MRGLARIILQKTTASNAADRTATVVNWDSSPVQNAPAGYFTFNATDDAITVHIPGIFLMNVVVQISPPSSSTAENNHLWLYRFNGTSWVLDRLLNAQMSPEDTNQRLTGSCIRRVTAAEIAAGDNRFRTLIHQAQNPGETLTYGASFTHFDVIRLDDA